MCPTYHFTRPAVKPAQTSEFRWSLYRGAISAPNFRSWPI